MKRHLALTASVAITFGFFVGADCQSTGERRSPPPATEDDAQCVLVETGFGPRGDVPVRAELVASGLEVPWGILFLEDEDMLVTERPGRLRMVRDGTLLAEPVATVRVAARGEGGLLGIAAHPQMQSNNLFYLYYTADAEGGTVNRVESWRLETEGDSPSASRVRVLLDKIAAASFHNGGRMRIGPDGMLYVGTGDAGEPSRSQDPQSPNGKLLRITPDGDVPEDNPFEGEPTYLYGIRNTQGFDWARRLALVDHGPSGEFGRTGHDEVNIVEKGDNLGWPTIFGCEEREGMVTPRLTWDAAVPPGGAAFYTGSAISAWRGNLLVGTLGSRHLHRVVLNEEMTAVTEHEVYFQGDPPEGLGRLRETVMGPDGHLYVTTSNCDGRGTCPADGDKIYRIVPR